MKIVVDENIPMADACFGGLGDVVPVPGRAMQVEDVQDADAVIVRSVTSVNKELLNGSSVSFVGTATIGTDHVDLDYLQERNIAFASAPGCNARAVADYVFTALLELESIRDFSLTGKTLGIVGLGNVGTEVKRTAELLGLEVLAYDPVRQEAGEYGLVSAEAVWQADIVTIHVPYEKAGLFPTHHLATASRLYAMKPGAVLINTARGSVLDNKVLSSVLEQRYDLGVILDVWEGEPNISHTLASQVDIATPHIAGYSYDGKIRGTWMIYQALCRSLNQECIIQMEQLLPAVDNVVLDFHLDEVRYSGSARDIVKRVYDIREDDIGLRTSLQLSEAQRAAGFDQLRKHYRVRRELPTVSIRNSSDLREHMPAEQFQRICGLGFHLG